MKAIDLFAGWGGFTEGAEQAGVSVVWAANHWKRAVEAHAMNHPNVQHVCQDLCQADWTSLPAYDLLLASPACQGHSTASQPKRRVYHDAMRATAWAVVACAEATRPKSLIVENVTAFGDWKLFTHWYGALEALGYHLSVSIRMATWHGVPQRRERLIITGSLRRPIPLPSPTEAPDEPAFGPCIEWSKGDWRPIKECRSEGAKARILRARARCGQQCLVQHVTGHPGVPLWEPIRTITTKDQWVVVDGSRYRPLTIREYARAQSFPDHYSWPDEIPRAETIKGLGNAIPPRMACDLVAAVAAAA